ncbi:sialidase family protein [Longispora sp. NPDC051575]|uniref:sialidase family protein n=1 Tax=Longispora sp. NPDC051575 TaxID=3154943 RepID=UPI00343E5AFF
MVRGVRLLAVVALAAALLGEDGGPLDRPEPKAVHDLVQARNWASKVAAWDPAHVYTTFLSCREDRCAFGLGATGDGGRTWARHPLPLDGFGARRPDLSATRFRLSVLGPGVLRLWWPARQPGPAWWSTDAGATWRSVPAALPVVRSVPPGWVPLDTRADDAPTGEYRLPVGDPATGAAALLAVPALVAGVRVPDNSFDRELWLTREGPDGGLLVSRDRGASHQPVTPPWPDGPDATFPRVALAPDGTVYLTASRVSRPEPLLARSTDGGLTWERFTPTGLGTARGPLRVGILPDGALVVASGEYLTVERFHVSRDGGRTFAEFPAAGYPRYSGGFVALPGGGYVTQDMIGDVAVDTLAVSDDLRTWRTLRPPTR